VVKDKCLRAAQLIEKAGQKTRAFISDGERDFERLSARNDLDFIYIATPWEWHVPQVLAALKEGKHVGTEVPAAYTLEDCWNIVEASEKARRHCLDHGELLLRPLRDHGVEYGSRRRAR
jgi:predicted dehydrogenase